MHAAISLPRHRLAGTKHYPTSITNHANYDKNLSSCIFSFCNVLFVSMLVPSSCVIIKFIDSFVVVFPVRDS